jgi:hypothetical protein
MPEIEKDGGKALVLPSPSDSKTCFAAIIKRHYIKTQ